jgi:hypothetical protein
MIEVAVFFHTSLSFATRGLLIVRHTWMLGMQFIVRSYYD